jgi:hypothetical protein
MILFCNCRKLVSVVSFYCLLTLRCREYRRLRARAAAADPTADSVFGWPSHADLTAPPPNEADDAAGAAQRQPRGRGCERRGQCRSKLALPIGGTGRAQYIMTSAGED